MSIQELVRPNILNLKPYASARDDFKGVPGQIFLDANENPYDSPFNRYPDPYQSVLKEQIALLKKVKPEQIFLGNGSDEAIDLLMRIFCEPAKDAIITMPPTYGMYEVCAGISNVQVLKVNLNGQFEPDTDQLLQTFGPKTKLLFVCRPNNPTANCLSLAKLERLIETFPGIVVVDEAYIEFSPQESSIRLLEHYNNLVVLQTFSKAWGAAGLRVGMAFSNPEIIQLLLKVKPPYNINGISQKLILELLEKASYHIKRVQEIILQRDFLCRRLEKKPAVEKVFPSEANFLLVKFFQANALFHHLIQNGIIVRNRSGLPGCEGCLRITIGTEVENNQLIEAIESFQHQIANHEPID